MNSLTKYNAARYALSVAVQVDEVKDIRDKAEAMAAYARQAKDTELVQWATEIKVRAERRAGQMLSEMPKATGKSGQFTGGHIVVPPVKEQTLADIGITKNESSRWQKLAAVSESQFEQAVSAAKEVAGEVTTAAMLRAAKSYDVQPDAPSMATPKPTPEIKPVTITNSIEPDYTELDAAKDQISDLQAALVVANMGDVSPDDKFQASNLIEELRADIRTLELTNKALIASRDSLQNENAQMKQQLAAQRRELAKIKA
jgi:hypothetical protein